MACSPCSAAPARQLREMLLPMLELDASLKSIDAELSALAE
jgi:hypothetical protein